MRIYTLNGGSVTYDNKSIDTITFHKASEVLDLEDIHGNGISEKDTVMAISFKDGSVSTYDAKNICIAEL